MPLLLDVATPHLSVHSNQSAELTLGGQPPGSFWSNFVPPNARDPKSFSNSFKISFSLRHVQMQCSQPIITYSVASLENNQAMLQNIVFKEGFCDSLPKEQLSASQDSVELEQKERLRRERISKANKGNSPWNKGRKHSPETIQKIRERTRLAMQDPKVKNKLVNLGHAQSQETKLKIGAGVRMGWEKRRNKLKLQETCCFEWQNLIAESSRNGLSGEEELDWCSYRVLEKQLLQEWSQSVELRRKARKVKGDKRALKSAEQRKRISQAITAKWKDPAYRNRVCSALAKYHGTLEGCKRKQKRNPTGSAIAKVNGKKQTRSAHLNPTDSASLPNKNKSLYSPSGPRARGNKPFYKDPLVSSKLEMIKSIRVQRVAADARKTKAVEQARLLIAEAESAANAIEFEAMMNPVARASIMEARKLIQEAIESLEFINVQSLISVAGPRNPSYNLNKVVNGVEQRDPINQQMNGTEQSRKTNMSGALKARDRNNNNFGSVNLPDMVIGDEKQYPLRPNNNRLPRADIEGRQRHKKVAVPTNAAKSPSSPFDNSVKSRRPKKTWIRGKLVEVMEES